MRFQIAAGSVLVALLAFSPSSVGHHSYAVYDLSKTITLKGTIAGVEWRNPHASIVFNVNNLADGKPAQWRLDLAGPACLERHGIAKESLTVGSTATLRNAPVYKTLDMVNWTPADSRQALVVSFSDGKKTERVHGVDPASSILEVPSVFARVPKSQSAPPLPDSVLGACAK